MTIGEFVLARSYLPKNGTHTMDEHVMAMLMTMSGTCSKLVVNDMPELVKVNNSKDEIEIKDRSSKVEVLDKFDIIVVKDEIERIQI